MRRSESSTKEEGLVEGRANKYAKGSDASGMYNVALAASSRGDGVAVGMRAVVSRTANAGLKIDYCTITRMLRAVLFLFHSSLIRESAGCGFHFPVYRVTTLQESVQNPVGKVLTRGSVRQLRSYVKNSAVPFIGMYSYEASAKEEM